MPMGCREGSPIKQSSLRLLVAGEGSCFGAGDGIRTHDTLLGKQMRYHCATPAWYFTLYPKAGRMSREFRAIFARRFARVLPVM